MRLIDKFSSKAELEQYLKHVGDVRKADNQPLRKGNLEEHVAKLVGVKDWNTALGMMAKLDSIGQTVCGRCESSLLPNGFCTDETCFHSDWPQGSDGQNPAERRIAVSAMFRSDNGLFKADFDAAPYFEHLIADHSAIAQSYLDTLFEEDGSGCCAADDVARSFTDSPALKPYLDHPEYSMIKAAFTYFDTPQAEDTGFEVYVNMGDLSVWLATHHPKLYNSIPEYNRGILETDDQPQPEAETCINGCGPLMQNGLCPNAKCIYHRVDRF